MYGLYKNVGSKMKFLANAICVTGIVYSLYVGILLMIGGLFLFGIPLFLLGPLLSWVVTWPLFGLGELVEKAEQEKQEAVAQISVCSADDANQTGQELIIE